MQNRDFELEYCTLFRHNGRFFTDWANFHIDNFTRFLEAIVCNRTPCQSSICFFILVGMELDL